jgi:hypothetical protein
VNLPEIEMVGLEPRKRFLQHAHRDILFAAMRADTGFGNHVVDFSLISNGGEMEAAHAQDRTFQAGLAQRALWRVEVAAVRLDANESSRFAPGAIADL